MSIPVHRERRILTQAEFEAVELTHHPAVGSLSREQLVDLVRRLREHRAKARDVAQQQRREMRGKAEPRGARPARDNTGTAIKETIFAGALKRAKRELRRLEGAGDETQAEIARRALELKRANRKRNYPSAGRTAGQGMRPVPSDRPTVTADPREVGRVSQFVKAAQARRDAT
jgi:hypothetical protein